MWDMLADMKCLLTSIDCSYCCYISLSSSPSLLFGFFLPHSPFLLLYALVLRTKLRATHMSGKRSATGFPLYLYVYLWVYFALNLRQCLKQVSSE